MGIRICTTQTARNGNISLGQWRCYHVVFVRFGRLKPEALWNVGKKDVGEEGHLGIAYEVDGIG